MPTFFINIVLWSTMFNVSALKYLCRNCYLMSLRWSNWSFHVDLTVDVFCAVTCRGSCGSASPQAEDTPGFLSLWLRKVYSQREGQNQGSWVTFNHASGACLMISISVEKQQQQLPNSGSHTITWLCYTQSHRPPVISTNQLLQLSTLTQQSKHCKAL